MSTAATGISPVLREVDVVGITNQECVAAYSVLTIRDSNICVSTYYYINRKQKFL
jgi:hypothetical protein